MPMARMQKEEDELATQKVDMNAVVRQHMRPSRREMGTRPDAREHAAAAIYGFDTRKWFYTSLGIIVIAAIIGMLTVLRARPVSAHQRSCDQNCHETAAWEGKPHDLHSISLCRARCYEPIAE